jgi:hypothetical protein
MRPCRVDVPSLRRTGHLVVQQFGSTAFNRRFAGDSAGKWHESRPGSGAYRPARGFCDLRRSHRACRAVRPSAAAGPQPTALNLVRSGAPGTTVHGGGSRCPQPRSRSRYRSLQPAIRSAPRRSRSATRSRRRRRQPDDLPRSACGDEERRCAARVQTRASDGAVPKSVAARGDGARRGRSRRNQVPWISPTKRVSSPPSNAPSTRKAAAPARKPVRPPWMEVPPGPSRRPRPGRSCLPRT